MATHAERRAQTRNKLVNSARILFEQQGFEATSIEAIIEHANVSKGTYYQHFETKLDVLAALEKEMGREQSQQIIEKIAAGAPALPILKQYLHNIGRWFEAREKIAKPLILSSLSTPPDTLEQQTHSGRECIHIILVSAQQQGTIRKDIDPKTLTQMVGGFIAVAVLHWSLDPQPDALVEQLMHAYTLFLEGASSIKNEGDSV